MVALPQRFELLSAFLRGFVRVQAEAASPLHWLGSQQRLQLLSVRRYVSRQLQEASAQQLNEC